MSSHVEIDTVGLASADWNIEEFKKYYEAHKEELDKVHTRTLNTHTRIFDNQGNRYRVIRRNGRTIIERVSNAELARKRDIIEQLVELRGQLLQLAHLFEELDKKMPKETEEEIVKNMLAIADKPEPIERHKI